MQRMISICRFGPLSGRSLPQQTRAVWPILRAVHHASKPPEEGPTAADIKKNVPELWVRKMKTFFAFYDQNCDGILNSEDFKMFEALAESNALSKNVDKEQIEKFKNAMRKLWMSQISQGSEKFEWTENQYLEHIFAAVSQPGAEEVFRDAAREFFNLMDLNGDGFISKEEDKAMRGGYPWSIVAFTAMDANRNGEVSRDEYIQTFVDFWFNFADDTNPSKHYMGPLVQY